MAINGIDPATFNPNAGREEAYNNRWLAYLTNLGQTQNKINVKKARKYFDLLFEQDWNNGAASREIDFISQKAKLNLLNLISKWRLEREAAELASQELDAIDFTNAGYIMNSEGNWIKPELPKTSPTPKSLVRPATDWNAVAASKLGTGKTTTDVARLQKHMAELGIDIGKNGADGMWGDDTQKAFDRFQGYEQFRGSEWDNITGTATPPLVQPNNTSLKPSPETPTSTGTYYTDNTGNRYSYTDNVLKKLSELDTKGWTNGGLIRDMGDFKKAVNFWSDKVSFGGMDWANPYYINNAFRYTNNDPDWNKSGSGANAQVKVKGKDGIYPLRVWNDRSFAIDVANGKAYELNEDMFGEVDGRGNDASINTYDLYSFFNKFPEDIKRLRELKKGGILNCLKTGGIIKQILKNSNVFPYNLL